MGDNVRYIGPYVISTNNDNWENIYKTIKNDLKDLRCIGYEIDPIFVPTWECSMRFENMPQFQNYLKGGTQVVNANPEIITKEIKAFKQKYKKDIEKLQKLEPLTLSWGLILQWS